MHVNILEAMYNWKLLSVYNILSKNNSTTRKIWRNEGKKCWCQCLWYAYYEQVYKGCTWIQTIMQTTNFKEPLWHKVPHIIWIPIVFSNFWFVFSGSRFFRDDTRLRALRFLDHMLVCETLGFHLDRSWNPKL